MIQIFSKEVRNQDKANALVAMARSGRAQRHLVLDYTLDNMETIKSVFDGVDIGRYLKVSKIFYFGILKTMIF